MAFPKYSNTHKKRRPIHPHQHPSTVRYLYLPATPSSRCLFSEASLQPTFYTTFLFSSSPPLNSPSSSFPPPTSSFSFSLFFGSPLPFLLRPRSRALSHLSLPSFYSIPPPPYPYPLSLTPSSSPFPHRLLPHPTLHLPLPARWASLPLSLSRLCCLVPSRSARLLLFNRFFPRCTIMAAPSNPSRFAELIGLLKEEYDRMSNENAGYKGVRAEWSRKVEEQVCLLSHLISCCKVFPCPSSCLTLSFSSPFCLPRSLIDHRAQRYAQ